MKRSKLDKVLWGVNLGPVKRVLPSDQLSPKIYAPQLCSVAVRSAGQVPAAARVAKQGGISGCAQQISQLIECLKGHEVDLPTVCLAQKKAVEQCRAEVASQRKKTSTIRYNREINGDQKNVTMNQVNRLLSWYPCPDKYREKFDNCFNNHYVKYDYFKRRGHWKPKH